MKHLQLLAANKAVKMMTGRKHEPIMMVPLGKVLVVVKVKLKRSQKVNLFIIHMLINPLLHSKACMKYKGLISTVTHIKEVMQKKKMKEMRRRTNNRTVLVMDLENWTVICDPSGTITKRLGTAFEICR